MPKDSLDKALHEDHFKVPLKYQPDHIDVDIRIHDTDNVDVETRYHYKDAFPAEAKPAYIELDFEDIKLSADERQNGASPTTLLSLEIDGTALIEGQDYSYIGAKHKIHLNIPNGKSDFILSAKTNVDPENNTTGVGLYMSDGNIFFKGETMNFRKVSPIQDRTDVLSTYKVTLRSNPNAEKLSNYNQLLSNGLLTDEGIDADGYTYTEYKDNAPKPCYLMGVQAGEFASAEYDHTFSNGHKVQIFTHAPLKDKDKDQYVVEGIKRGMEYLDKEFGLIYDKPEYHITSLTTFNAGATETKTMPMFSASYFTTDKDFVYNANLLDTMAVVIHEYIHEFIGNTFYINNWLELGSKEGQTVFLEQLATAAMLADADVVRMGDMNGMVNSQFAKEDDQKLPPIPKSLNSERDHYSSTTYSKGAECFRMMHTLMGHDNYTKLVKEYVDNHYTQNGGIDDFLALAEQHHNFDYTGKFSRWFKQAGRATVTSQGHYKPDSQEFVVSLQQSFKDDTNKPLPIPLNMALCIDGAMEQEQIFVFDQENDAIVFKNVTKQPDAYSINRGFSAPIEVNHDQDSGQALKLLAAESDGVTQLQIIQDIHNKEILKRYQALKTGQTVPAIPNSLSSALQTLVTRNDIAPDVLAQLLTPAPCGGLRAKITNTEPLTLFKARESYLNDISSALYSEMDAKYADLRAALSGPYKEEKALQQNRTLASTLIRFTSRANNTAEQQKIMDLYNTANCGHDRLVAASLISALRSTNPQEAASLEADFLTYMSADTNGTLKAMDILVGETVSDPQALLHRVLNDTKYSYDWGIPHHGKMVSLHFAANYENFHKADGSGYEAIADMAIAAGKINPEVAAAVGGHLTSLNNFDATTAAKMHKALERINSTPSMPLQLRKAVEDAMDEYSKKNGAQCSGKANQNCNP
jgi:aminopeptidase N